MTNFGVHYRKRKRAIKGMHAVNHLNANGSNRANDANGRNGTNGTNGINEASQLEDVETITSDDLALLASYIDLFSSVVDLASLYLAKQEDLLADQAGEDTNNSPNAAVT